MSIFNKNFRHKIFPLVFILVFFQSIKINSQSGEAQSFEIGNRWIYFNDAGGGNNYYVYKEIIGDTIINSTRYAIVKDNEYYSYQRADSDKVYSFNLQDSTENINVDYSLNIGDTLKPNFYVVGKEITNIWGKTLRKICIRHTYISYWTKYWYTEWIGFTSGEGHIPGTFYNIKLLAAIIENNIYGDTTFLDISFERMIPNDFTLYQNYPNPFNSLTTINYKIPKEINVTIKIFDCIGNEIKTLVREIKKQGYYAVEFDASNLTSGIYFYQLKTDEFISTKKMVLLR